MPQHVACLAHLQAVIMAQRVVLHARRVPSCTLDVIVMKSYRAFYLCALIVAGALLPGCKTTTSPTNPVVPEAISTGTMVDAGTSTIGQGGGTITVNRPGTPVDGMTITVPQQAYGSARTFSISEAPITAHTFGDKLVPITPLIRVDNGGGYADSIMTLRIPARIGAGDFALGFAYDATQGTLEALPVIAEDSTGITIATRHFSQQTGNGGGRLTRVQTGKPYMDIVVSKVSVALLESLGKISTGFTPDRDDWEFANLGSYIAPKGHCAGQSISMMWYYAEHFRKGEPQLHHALDQLHDYQWDNPFGYRMASVVQCDIDWETRSRSLFSWLRKDASYTQWLAFAAAMYVTGEPQYCGIRNEKEGWGHAIVANAIDMRTGTLGVVDPNFPGMQREILYGAAGFQPYKTGQTAASTDELYELVGFFAKTALVDWDKIGNRWTQLLDKTIGDGAFPNPSLEYLDGTFRAMPDTLHTGLDSLKLNMRPATPSVWWGVVDEAGVPVPFSATGRYALAPGWRKIGIVRYMVPTADCRGIAYKGGDKNFIDFKWYAIQRSAFTIESVRPDGAPFKMGGAPDTVYTFKCNGQGAFPHDVELVWDFGDQTQQRTVYDDTTVTHAFAKVGTYAVKVTVINYRDGSTVDTAGRDVMIDAPKTTLTGALDTLVDIQMGHPVHLHFTWMLTGYSPQLYDRTKWQHSLRLGRDVPAHFAVYVTAQGEPPTWRGSRNSDSSYYVSTIDTLYISSPDSDGVITTYGTFPHATSGDGGSMTADMTFNDNAQNLGLLVKVYGRIRSDLYDKHDVLKSTAEQWHPSFYYHTFSFASQ